MLETKLMNVSTYRRYYYLSWFKQVKVYTDNESFGELALITDKHRKAKLETI